MTRLKRQGGVIQQVPNGNFFRQPEINWDSRKVLGMHPSFETLVGAVISARAANPHHVQQHHWSLDRAVVAEEVERFLVKVCQSMGWTNFLAETGGGSPLPFHSPISPQDQGRLNVAAAKARKLWAGIQTVAEWLKSEAPAVPQEQAEKRAATCVACPFNSSGDLTTWFTAPSAGAIKRQLERVQERKLSTSLDDKLGICAEKDGNGGCLCPNKLSVWVPLNLKLAHMSAEVKAGMHSSCWLFKEEKGIGG